MPAKVKYEDEDLLFNLCEQNLPRPDECKDVDGDFYAYIIRNDGSCVGLKNDTKKADTFAVDMRNSDGELSGLSLNYYGTGACQIDNSREYLLRVNITCDHGSNFLTYINTEGDKCSPVVNYKGEAGCYKFSFNQLTQFFMDNEWLWGAILIIVGLFLAFFGNQFVNAVIFIVVSVAVVIILASVFFQLFFKKVSKDWAKWLAFAAILLVGCGVGYLFVRLRKWGVALIAAWGGVMLGFLITSTFAIGTAAGFYCTIIAAGLIMFIVGLKVEKALIIMVTAFTGSYSIVRGVSLYAGGFPSEIQLHEEIAAGAVDWKSYDKTFYIYLGAILVSTILAAFFQFKREQKLSDSLRELKRPIR